MFMSIFTNINELDMDKSKISREFILGCILTVSISILGGWSASTEIQNDNTRRISIIEEKYEYVEAANEQIISMLNEITQGQQNISINLSEIASDVKLLKATKADRKYVE